MEKELGVDPGTSWVVGDMIRDLEAGQPLGCSVVLLRTGYGLESEEMLAHQEFRLNHMANDVLEAS